jgi:hypothetical protein
MYKIIIGITYNYTLVSICRSKTFPLVYGRITYSWWIFRTTVGPWSHLSIRRWYNYYYPSADDSGEFLYSMYINISAMQNPRTKEKVNSFYSYLKMELRSSPRSDGGGIPTRGDDRDETSDQTTRRYPLLPYVRPMQRQFLREDLKILLPGRCSQLTQKVLLLAMYVWCDFALAGEHKTTSIEMVDWKKSWVCC